MLLKGDKDGFAGRYEGEGLVWTVSKVYLGRGIGARWQVKGPYFGDTPHNFASIGKIVQNWTSQGVVKVA